MWYAYGFHNLPQHHIGFFNCFGYSDFYLASRTFGIDRTCTATTKFCKLLFYHWYRCCRVPIVFIKLSLCFSDGFFFPQKVILDEHTKFTIFPFSTQFTKFFVFKDCQKHTQKDPACSNFNRSQLIDACWSEQCCQPNYKTRNSKSHALIDQPWYNSLGQWKTFTTQLLLQSEDQIWAFK